MGIRSLIYLISVNNFRFLMSTFYPVLVVCTYTLQYSPNTYRLVIFDLHFTESQLASELMGLSWGEDRGAYPSSFFKNI